MDNEPYFTDDGTIKNLISDKEREEIEEFMKMKIEKEKKELEKFKQYCLSKKEAIMNLFCDETDAEFEDTVMTLDEDFLCHYLATRIFDNSDLGGDLDWIKENFPEFYVKAMEYYITGRHDT